MRNCPGTAERAGKPPRLGSQTPGVVMRKLRVVRNIPTARALTEGRNPRQERAGSDEERDGDFDDAKQGREASDAQGAVDPTHQRAVGDERTNPFGLVSRELHEADPPHHDHQAIASQRGPTASTWKPSELFAWTVSCIKVAIIRSSQLVLKPRSRFSDMVAVATLFLFDGEKRTPCHLPERCPSVVVTCSMQGAFGLIPVERTSRSCITRASISTKYREAATFREISMRDGRLGALSANERRECRATGLRFLVDNM